MVGEELGISLVIHMDPIDVNNETVNDTKQKMSDALRVINENLTLHDFRMTPLSEKRTNLIFDVVIPSGSKLKEDELNDRINTLAKTINPTFTCVITFDRDFTGK